MIKRIILCTLCMMLCFSVCTFADEVVDQQQTTKPQQGEQMRGSAGMRGFLGEVQPVEGQRPPEITMPDSGNMPQFEVPFRDNMPTMPQDGENNGVVRGEDSQQPPEQNIDGGRVPFGDFPGMQPNDYQTEVETPKTFKEIAIEYFTPIVSLILLALGFVFVIFYKRKTY